MATSIKFTCRKCHKHSLYPYNPGQAQPNICADCNKLEDQEALETHLNGMVRLSIEDRLGRIETFLWHHFKGWIEQ